MKISLFDRNIEQHQKPVVIAEMSGNHNGKLDRALALVDAASEAGVDAVKLQTYTADTMTLNCQKPDFYINDSSSLWNGRHLHELYQEAHTPWEWHQPIMDRAKEKGIVCFSTPFDHTAVDFLETLNVPCYKIASFENTDVNLIRKVASTGKPIIVSTGMASLADLELMVKTIKEAGCEQFLLLKCTSAYPATYDACNLKTIPHLSQMFNCPVGLSDHTMGITAPIAATALGACVIEKHFTLSRNDGGVDAAFSLEKEELKEMVKQMNNAWHALGSVQYQNSAVEEKSKTFRRSIYFKKAINGGEIISNDHIACIRPGYGAEPKYYEQCIGRFYRVPAKAGDPLHYRCVDEA